MRSAKMTMRRGLVLISLLVVFVNSQKQTFEIEGRRNPLTFECISGSGKPGKCNLIKECDNANSTSNPRFRTAYCGKQINANNDVICCDDLSKYLEPIESGWYFPGTRISQIKCDEYKSFKKRLDDIEDILWNRLAFSCNNSVCNPLYFGRGGIGGEDALPDEFPHMAVLGWEKHSGGFDWDCGGTLISENYVLTAAHCLFRDDDNYKTYEPTVVKLGDTKPIEIQIKTLTPHPGYKPPRKYDDIALIELAEPVKFFEDIRPACLSTKKNPTGRAMMLGWGYIDLYGTRPSRLQKVRLDIYDDTTCKRLYEVTRNLPNGILNSQLCAGFRKGGRDACNGDSGGPIQIHRSGGLRFYEVIGVVSFGKECGSVSGGVYTKVAEYLYWIEDKVWGMQGI